MEQEKIDKAFKADEESKLMVTLLNEIAEALKSIAESLKMINETTYAKGKDTLNG